MTVLPPGSRVPAALQQIFLQSQRGDNVEKISAPKKLGFRVFGRKGKQKGIQLGGDSKRGAPSLSKLYLDRGDGKETAASASRKAIRNRNDESSSVAEKESPQAYLSRELEKRGYSTQTYCSLEGGYYCRPTPLQQASYGSAISKAIRGSDGIAVRKMMDCGLSPNPCNNFGESLIHMVCRRGDAKLLRILLEAGCSLQVTDDYGRTPLHDACWRADPSFETVQLILDSDKHLVQLLDCRGSAPLQYVKPENYARWIEFIESKLDRFWPARDVASEGDERPPPLVLRPPHALPIPDPEHALPIEVATMVANGQMDPEEAMFLDEESDSDSDFSDSDFSDSDDDMDEEEFKEICFRAGGPMAVAQRCFAGAGAGSPMKRA